MRIVLDDSKMDAAATKVSAVQSGLDGLQGRLTPGLSAGAPPAIKGQVDAAVADARQLVGAVSRRCPGRAAELRQRAILTRLAAGDIRVADLGQLLAWASTTPKGKGGGRLPIASASPFFSLKKFGDDVMAKPGRVLDWVYRNPLEAAHLTLDTIGMAPGLGEPADLFSGLIYLGEGDEAMAALSAGAAVPFAGNVVTAGKWGKKGTDAAAAARRTETQAAHRARIARARADLISPERANHILIGDFKRNKKGKIKHYEDGKPKWNGGHRWPGRPDKRPFPPGWSDERILNLAADIASRRASLKPAEIKGTSYSYDERHGGILVRVAVNNDTGQVMTAFPLNTPVRKR